MNEINTTKLSKQQRKWWREYLKCFNNTTALQRANPDKDYTTHSATTIGAQVKKAVFAKLGITIDDVYELMGLDDQSLMNIGLEGMKATRPIITPDGLKAVPDYGVRHKYWNTFMEIRKAAVPQGSENKTLNIVITDERTLIKKPEIIEIGEVEETDVNNADIHAYQELPSAS